MTNTKLALIILLALNEIRGIIVTAPAWAWLWQHWHALLFTREVLFHR